jgi:hypothetical protein
MRWTSIGASSIVVLFAAFADADAVDINTCGGLRRHAVFVEDASRLPLSGEPPDTSSTGVNLVDVDADGDLDLFLAEGTASLAARPNFLFINDGCGFFRDESATRLPQGMDANSVKADFADVDGDGDLDAIVANLGPEQLLLNDGRGRFSDGASQLPAPPDLFSDISASARFADVTADGCPDILVANENPFDPDPLHGAQNRLLVNDCSGNFSDQTSTRLPALTDQSAVLLDGDIHRDGDVDLLVLDRGQEHVLINDGSGVFTDQAAARFPVTSDATRSGALADLDGDGDLDLVTSNSRGQKPALYVNSRGKFRAAFFDYNEAPNQTDTELLLVNLNGDRYPDLYVANAGKFDSGHGFEGGPDHFFVNQRGSFVEATAAHATFPANQASTAAALGDIDGDGDPDLVVAGTGNGELGRERVFLQLTRGKHHRCRPRP